MSEPASRVCLFPGGVWSNSNDEQGSEVSNGGKLDDDSDKREGSIEKEQHTVIGNGAGQHNSVSKEGNQHVMIGKHYNVDSDSDPICKRMKHTD